VKHKFTLWFLGTLIDKFKNLGSNMKMVKTLVIFYAFFFLILIVLVGIKGPKPYVGSWTLSEDIDRSEEE